jgi:hypothetical protein
MKRAPLWLRALTALVVWMGAQGVSRAKRD